MRYTRAPMRRAPLLVILLAGLLLRIVYLSQVASLPFFDHPVGDSALYLARAAEIRSGKILPDRPLFYGSALYPYGLAAILALPGGSLDLVGLAQALAGTLLVYLLARAARRIGGRAAGLAAGGLAAMYGPFAFFESDVLGVVWGLLAMALGIAWCLRWESRPRSLVRYLVPSGAAFGLAAAERPNLMLLVPIVALWAARAPSEGERARGLAWAPALAVVAGAMLAFAPVVMIQLGASGGRAALNTSGGINLCIGNNPRASGTFEEPWAAEDPQFTATHTDLEESSVRMASRLAGRPLDGAEASGFWAGRALDFVRAEPAAFLRITARKAALLWNAAEAPNHLDFVFLREVAPSLRLMFVGFGVLAPLSVAGFALGLARGRNRRALSLLAALAAGAMISVLPFFVADRYRAAMVPPLLIAAGCGAAHLARAAFVRGLPGGFRAGLSLLPAVVMGGVAQIPLLHPDLSRDHWMLAQAWRARGDLPEARSEYEAALRESGEDAILLNNLARVYRSMGKEREAESALRRAITAGPSLAYPHKNLGLLLIGASRFDEALAELEAALRLGGDDAEALGALAAIHAGRGERDEAAALYAKARRLDPSDPRLARLVEMYPYLAGSELTSPRSRP
ncbi:MAG: tetratricopeptide repeat protein [Acidobacteria bacterium]|nr:tetratricopeptide repeat protein [Acidobacteriota bacterium]